MRTYEDDVIAILDGDIVAYEVASASETPINWGDGLWTLHAFEEPSIARMRDRIAELKEKTGANRVIIALSDTLNWRKEVLPTYKSNRATVRRPMILGVLRQHLIENYETAIWANLEADDVMGIMATDPEMKGKKIIVTKDKDLQTIPGYHYLMHKEELGVFEVDLETADKWHLIQAMAGDTTDGYSGCPGIGVETARKLIENPFVYKEYEHTFKSGVRKGQTEKRLEKVETDSVWEAIVSHFERAGLNEAEALTQARIARILRHGEYNLETFTVNLWEPRR